MSRSTITTSSQRPSRRACFSYTPTSRNPCLRHSARLASFKGKMRDSSFHKPNRCASLMRPASSRSPRQDASSRDGRTAKIHRCPDNIPDLGTARRQPNRWFRHRFARQQRDNDRLWLEATPADLPQIAVWFHRWRRGPRCLDYKFQQSPLNRRR